MPHIFDNIEHSLLAALQKTIDVSDSADFCVGYFNLRGWRQLDRFVDRWGGGPKAQCRLLVGMQRLPQDQLRDLLVPGQADQELDQQTAVRIKRRLAEEFREQLTVGVPTSEDEDGLRRLARQIREKKVVVKLYLRHPLHAKLYLLHRPDPINPLVGYLGSSNLTFAGLHGQGELNIDVLDGDATAKLATWFDARWNDRWCIDISSDLLAVIEESWARDDLIPPFHIYIKMAYHLSRDARAGLAEYQVPREFRGVLLEFQEAAVRIAAHHVSRRGGAILGDVVGLGKTLMASALCRMLEDEYGMALIVCPKNLEPMWQDYRQRYGLRATIVPLSQVQRRLSDLRRHRLVVIDESHNLRNREGQRYKAIAEYIHSNDSKVVLLSATPYNKTYVDLANQLRLFLREDEALPIRPEMLLGQLGETEFLRQHQCAVNSIAAFEKSFFADDWRELMRLFLVRRTRSFIQTHYAETDPSNGRRYLALDGGRRSYFPLRIPKTKRFRINDADPQDQYARLYGDDVVDTINALRLPRYGLGNYQRPSPEKPPTSAEAAILRDLSRGGRRLMGFCRTNLFKRMESSGQTFLQSVERHILRNFVFIHAIENGLPIPIGTQSPELLDPDTIDSDMEANILAEDDADAVEAIPVGGAATEVQYRARAAEIYASYAKIGARRFKWLPSRLFTQALKADMEADCEALLRLVARCGRWDQGRDAKLDALVSLLKKHAGQKVLVFSQFADTVDYLVDSLRQRKVAAVEGVTGDSENPTESAWRFSPVSNGKREHVPADKEIRVLVATDILSEGQNLQDCAIVINYDVPWAIIRLIQRAGRVDRIGQTAEDVVCYTFLPADGVERIIRLRARVSQRLKENAEVIGTDESFFDSKAERNLVDLYSEKSGILDGDEATEVDLASYAYQIWKNAIRDNPELERVIESMPNVVFSTRGFQATKVAPHGALLFMRTPDGNDSLAWVDQKGRSVTESQFAILRAAECDPSTPALPRLENHHNLVAKGVLSILQEERASGGQLGRPSGARFRTYERLKQYLDEHSGTLFDSPDLRRAVEEIYRFPLLESAKDLLNKNLKAGASDAQLADLVIALRADGRLCMVTDDDTLVRREPQIICSLGLAPLEYVSQ